MGVDTVLESISKHVVVFKRFYQLLFSLTGSLGHDEPLVQVADVKCIILKLYPLILLLSAGLFVLEEGVSLKQFPTRDKAISDCPSLSLLEVFQTTDI
jgi:hypothetical protein